MNYTSSVVGSSSSISSSSPSFLINLLIANTETALNIFLMLSLGMVLSHPRIGYIDQHMIAKLSKVFIKFILPLFLFGLFAKFDLSHMKKSSPAIFYSLFSLIIQFITAWLSYTDWSYVLRILSNYFCHSTENEEKSREDLKYIQDTPRTSLMKRTLSKPLDFIPRHLLFLTIAFHSAFIIPYPYIVSFSETEGIFKDPNRKENALAFLSLHSLPARMIYYSFGIWYGGLDKKSKRKHDQFILEQQGTKPLSIENLRKKMFQKNASSNSSESNSTDIEDQSSSSSSSCISSLTSSSSSSNTNRDPINENNDQETKVSKLFDRFCCFLKKAIGLFPNSIYFMFAGLFISSIPSLKNFLFQNPPPLVKVIPKVIGKWSNAMSPIAFIIIGGKMGILFYTKKQGQDEQAIKMRNRRNADVERKNSPYNLFFWVWDSFEYIYSRVIRYNSVYNSLVSVIGKLIVVPTINLIVLIVIASTVPEFLVPEEMSRPIFFTVMVVTSAVPCMMSNIVVGVSVGVGGNELAEVILLQYLISPFTIVIFAVLSMYIFCRIEEGTCYC